MIFCFWLLLFLSFYGYAGYPILLFVLTKLTGKKRLRTDFTDGDLPSVTILVAAYNEEKNIEKKINSLLDQNYPAARVEIYILDDGSTDTTAARVKAFTAPGLYLLSLPRQGKASALNEGVKRAKNDILVFSDADIIWDPTTLRALITPFSSPRTGAVAGRLSIQTGLNHLGSGDSLYRRYEAVIRTWETDLASAVSADGGIFALRRELWQEIPPDVTDDFFISTATIVHGRAIVFEEKAVVYDAGVEHAKSQLKRRVRITVRGMTSLWRRRELFNPFRFGLYSLFLLSHKLIRRLVPCFGLLLLPVSLTLFHLNLWYALFVAAQLCFYTVGLIGLWDRGRRLPKIFSLVSFVLLSSYGLFVGVLQFLSGKRYTFWSSIQNR